MVSLLLLRRTGRGSWEFRRNEGVGRDGDFCAREGMYCNECLLNPSIDRSEKSRRFASLPDSKVASFSPF